MTVTNLRLIFGDKTYAMSNITSVAFGVNRAIKLPGVLLILIAILGFLLFAGRFDALLAGLVFGLVIGGLGVRTFRKAKKRYTVRLGSASGETDAISSADEQKVLNIVDAVNAAFVRRGLRQLPSRRRENLA